MSAGARRPAAEGFRALEDESTVDADAWPALRKPPVAVGVAVADRYELRAAISRGLLGQVWRAFDRARGEEVAVKLVPKPAEPDGRFAREAAILRQLGGDRFVTVFDWGTTDRLGYFVMQLLRGEDLATHLDRVKRLEPAACVDLVETVAVGLAQAHEAGVVHRDITPKNIFLETTGAGHRIRILDFGLAKHATIQARLTKSGVLLGTPHYMSPEQIVDPHRVDARTDIWSLATIAYRALSGRRPFEGESLRELLGNIGASAPAPLTALVPGLRREVDALFERALAKDPRARFPDAPALAAALRAALLG